MIAQRLRCGVPVGITRCPTICRMCSTQLPCQIDGRIISRICGRQDVISSRKDWFCPSVDGLWGRDGRRDALPELGSKKLGKLIKGMITYPSVISSFAGSRICGQCLKVCLFEHTK